MPMRLDIPDNRVALLPRNLLDALQDAGIDPQALALRLGLEPGAPEQPLTLVEADRFLCAAWDAVADPAIGLRAGCVMKPERFGVVGIAAMTSPDFGTAIQRKARYWRLVWADAYEVRLGGSQAAAVLPPVGPTRPYTAAKVDMELASLLTFGRRFTGRPIVPLRLTLSRPAPPWRRRYDEVFGCPVLFSHPENSLAFARSDFDLPLLSRNDQVSDLVTGGAEAALDRLALGTLRLQVGLVVDRMLQGDEPTLTGAAARMHRSARTLQRQLAQENLRFTDVLDERRRSAAERYLVQRSVTAEEVAFLLGFSTASSFFRAFKRWTGLTPEGWRKARATA